MFGFALVKSAAYPSMILVIGPPTAIGIEETQFDDRATRRGGRGRRARAGCGRRGSRCCRRTRSGRRGCRRQQGPSSRSGQSLRLRGRWLPPQGPWWVRASVYRSHCSRHRRRAPPPPPRPRSRRGTGGVKDSVFLADRLSSFRSPFSTHAASWLRTSSINASLMSIGIRIVSRYPTIQPRPYIVRRDNTRRR